MTSRGNARAAIFDDDSDRTLFLTILSHTVKRFNWLCHAYCLMDNNYHLMIVTPEGVAGEWLETVSMDIVVQAATEGGAICVQKVKDVLTGMKGMKGIKGITAQARP